MSTQIKPDFYPSLEALQEGEKKFPNTNPRYKFFCQTHFTAGDSEQFESNRDMTNGILSTQNISLKDNVAELPDFSWEKYENIGPLSVENTFNYMFHKFKKGIFLKIKNGELKVFLPFSKKNFTNEWKKYIQVDGDLNTFIQSIQTGEGRKFNPKGVNKFIDSWYANNCLLRWEFPISEGDTNVPNVSDMFKTLCKERNVPDMELFVNRRDFPIIRKDCTEPYNHIFGQGVPLVSHNYSKYCPILSMVGGDEFADIPIPTGEDWARVCREEGKWFSKTGTRSYKITPTPWKNRKPTAVFRGASTGSGVTIDTNPRLKLAYLSSVTPVDKDKIPLLDAGITEWNLRPRKIEGEKYLKTIDVKNLPFGLVNRLTPQEQTSYKYLVHVDGHVSAYRLSLELEFGSCILLAESKYRLWFRHLLIPYTHYVPVKEDLSDLVEKIRWCKENDAKCKKIAKNAGDFAKKYLTKEGILDYLQKLLINLKKVNGIYVYNSVSLETLQEKRETDILQKNRYIPKIQKDEISLFPDYNRCYGLLKGAEWVVNKVDFLKTATKDKELFNNKSTKVTIYSLAGMDFAVKETEKSVIHEAFVTTQTNELLKQIPNFAYTFCAPNRTTLISEKITGETLYNYIKGKNFRFSEFLSIFAQLALALHVAQKSCRFVHNDLAPWNIIVQKLPEQATFDYPIDSQTVYRIRTKTVPIIIDMGRAHIVHKNIHYGTVNPFSFSTIHDIVSLLDISVYEISNRNLDKETVADLVKLANFISRTSYRRKPFAQTGKNGLGDIRYFFGKAKKFSELVGSDKLDLEKKTPIDFVKYLILGFKFSEDFTIQTTNSLVHTLDIGSPMQVFEYTFSKTDRERALTFAKVFSRMEKSELPELPYLFQYYYIAQTVSKNIETVYEQMTVFLEKSGIDGEKFNRKFRKVVKIIEKRFRESLQKKETFNVKSEKKEDVIYDEKIFLFPEKVLQMLRKNAKLSAPSSDLRDILQTVILRKNSPYVADEKLYKNYEPESCLDRLETLRLVSSEIYSSNLESFNYPEYEEIYKECISS